MDYRIACILLKQKERAALLLSLVSSFSRGVLIAQAHTDSARLCFERLILKAKKREGSRKESPLNKTWHHP